LIFGIVFVVFGCDFGRIRVKKPTGFIKAAVVIRVMLGQKSGWFVTTRLKGCWEWMVWWRCAFWARQWWFD
jgi:hypothetical protein